MPDLTEYDYFRMTHKILHDAEFMAQCIEASRNYTPVAELLLHERDGAICACGKYLAMAGGQCFKCLGWKSDKMKREARKVEEKS